MNEKKKKEFEEKFCVDEADPINIGKVIKIIPVRYADDIWQWIDNELKQAKINQCNKIFELAKENERFGQMQLFALGDILSIVNSGFNEERIKQLEKKWKFQKI